MIKSSKHPKKIWIFYLIILVVLAGLQFLQSSVPNPPVSGDFEAPANVKSVIKRACYDCHSNETKLKWYDKIAPVSWLVASDVKKARAALNFSNWDSLPKDQQTGNLYTVLNFMLLKAMPLPSYTLLHPDAKVSETEIQILKRYVASLIPVNVTGSPASKPDSASPGNEKASNTNTVVKTIAPAPNGINYPTGYTGWTAVSTTDRFDNGTMRIIYANNVAVDAIRQHRISPWPDGSIMAKVLWKQITDKDGQVSPGAFIHAEFMIKDAGKYGETNGWGWARWVGKDLKPYGKTAAFVAECMDCHQPMKDNDFVFTMPLNLKNEFK